MADHGLDFFTRHALQQAGRHRHQGVVLESASRKGIGFAFVDTHFRHANAGLVGELAHGVQNPGFISVARLCDHMHATGPLGHGLGDQQRNDGATKTHDEGKAQQCAQIQAVGGQKTVDAQQAGRNTQHGHDGNVGQQKKCNTFHGV